MIRKSSRAALFIKSTKEIIMTSLTAEYFQQYLLKIYHCSVPFSVKVSTKRPKTRVGSYGIRTKNINIYYAGFVADNSLRETAIHEYAHHLHHTERGLFTNLKTKSDRSHGSHFWIIYSFLMTEAYRKGLYTDDYMLPMFNKSKIY